MIDLNKKEIEYNKAGSYISMVQPKSMENKAEDSLSPSIMRGGQLRTQVQTSTNVEYFDNSSSLNGVVSGQTASIKFTRGDDLTKSFLMQKRAGSLKSQDNVWELYPVKANLNAGNFLFIGRDGLANFLYTSVVGLAANIDKTQFYSTRNGSIQAELCTDNVEPSTPQLNIFDARADGSTKVGVIAELIGTGDDGYAGIAHESGKYFIIGKNGIEMTGGLRWVSGTGSPEGSITAPVGSIYTRTDGSTSTTLYVKTSGTGNTGWTNK